MIEPIKSRKGAELLAVFRDGLEGTIIVREIKDKNVPTMNALMREVAQRRWGGPWTNLHAAQAKVAIDSLREIPFR